MDFIRDYWSQFLTGLSTLGLTIGSLGFSWRTQPPPFPPWRQAMGSVDVMVGGSNIYYFRKRDCKKSQRISLLNAEAATLRSSLQRLQSLEEDVQQKYNDLCSLHLSGIMSRMGLSDNDRVSIYKHNGTSFYRIGRHSNHPGHARPGRSIYPDNQGCMGEALREGVSYDENLPAKAAAYDLRLFQKWAIPKDTTDLLTMRSRSIAAFALHRPIGGRRFAIIVFESMSPGSIDEACRNSFTREEQNGIIQWLETMERFEPKPNEAKREVSKNGRN